MDAIRFRLDRLFICAVLMTVAVPLLAGDADLRDAPVVWYDDDRQDISEPHERKPNLYKDMVVSSVSGPIGTTLYPPRAIRNLGVLFGGDHVQAAANVNVLDEVPNCSWFTNRIGLFPMAAAVAAAGPGDGKGPDRSAPWRVVGAKTEGVTPGFTIKDALGNRFLIKFDPPGYPGMTSAAGVISGRILHAAGYNVPDDSVVHFRRDELLVEGRIEIECPDGTVKVMTEEVLDRLLSEVFQMEDGRYLAIASRFLEGRPVGPFNFEKQRGDDPNDHIRHQDRRELRGLRVFAAWLSHFDTKQGNTLDMFVERDGRHYIRHNLIDFASSLGAGARGPSARFSYEYTLSIPAVVGRLASLGLNENDWRRLKLQPGLDEIGYFDSEHFDPREFRPLMPNPAFGNRTDRDGYWAAKIITAFTDEHLAAIVAEGKYRNPEATAYMARTLAERRDIIGECYFDRVPPLDFFTVSGSEVRYHDLGAERGIYPSESVRYRSRGSACDAGRRSLQWSEWSESDETVIALAEMQTSRDRPFLVVQCQVNRGQGWSAPVAAYIAPDSDRIVAVER